MAEELRVKFLSKVELGDLVMLYCLDRGHQKITCGFFHCAGKYHVYLKHFIHLPLSETYLEKSTLTERGVPWEKN